MLAEIAERCEKATGPDRQLDAMIHWQVKDGCGVGYAQDSPAFTASIDAALTLAKGVGVLITLSEIKGDGMPLCVIGNPETAQLFEAVAATPALALCAAALRALSHKESR